MGEWQLIETAPRDQRILGWDGDEILTLDWNRSAGGYWQQVSDSGRSSAYYPTHWMPLPEPPALTPANPTEDVGCPRIP